MCVCVGGGEGVLALPDRHFCLDNNTGVTTQRVRLWLASPYRAFKNRHLSCFLSKKVMEVGGQFTLVLNVKDHNKNTLEPPDPRKLSHDTNLFRPYFAKLHIPKGGGQIPTWNKDAKFWNEYSPFRKRVGWVAHAESLSGRRM